MDSLSAIDTAGVEPMAQVLYEAEETATLRQDAIRPPLGNEAALANLCSVCVENTFGVCFVLASAEA